MIFVNDHSSVYSLLQSNINTILLFKLIGDILYSIYFIRGGQMEILKNNESQAILGRNDILGEHPCRTQTPGKSRCVVKGNRKTFNMF